MILVDISIYTVVIKDVSTNYVQEKAKEVKEERKKCKQSLDHLRKSKDSGVLVDRQICNSP